MTKEKLYKFRTVDTYSLTSLASNKLWFSSLESFNDPFEGTYKLNRLLSDELIQHSKSVIDWKPKEEVGEDKYLEMLSAIGLKEGEFTHSGLVKALAEYDLNVLIDIIHRSKVVCLSLQDEEKDPITEKLMWSHYADGMRGFCLVFDAEKLARSMFESSKKAVRPIKVSYQDQPNTLNLSEFFEKITMRGDSEDDFVHAVTDTIATKSTDWSYENELRLLSLDDDNLYRYTSDSLLEIVIGDKMPQDQQQLLISTVKSTVPQIVLRKACLKKDSYEIEIVDYQ